jgi:hypothetical protein
MNRKTVKAMPKKADPNKKTESGNYKSQYAQSAKYDSNNVDNIRLRVPKGWGQLMKDYVASNDKYSSVNAMIVELIKKECSIDD